MKKLNHIRSILDCVIPNPLFVLIVGAFIMGICSCKKFVQISPPTTKLVTASVFNNVATATSAQTAIYSSMVSNEESINMEIDCALLSDELTNYNTTLSYVQLYTNSMTASTAPGPWKNAFSYIYQANAIISGVQGNTGLTTAVQQQLVGESKFVRAFWLFYLTNLYGPVPLVTSTDYAVNDTISRAPQAQVYQQIIADLKDAQNLMNPNFIDLTDTAVTMDRGRPNKAAAAALLARVYLYTNQYDSAEAEATAVIGDNPIVGRSNLNNGLYALIGLDSVFLMNSAEAIWQLDIPLPDNGYNTPDGETFILTSAPSGFQCCSIAPQLLNNFEAGDNRRMEWIDSFQTSGLPIINYYFPYKYKVQYDASGAVSEYVMVLRLAEQYLIRAEARAQQGNVSGAIEDLNIIRFRANLPNYSAIANGPLLSAILHERQVELFTEWGHRWFDLIRTNSVDSVMSVVAPQKQGIWNMNNEQSLFPIPRSEILADPKLTQNAGY